jgi:hypothetical protein
MLMTAATTTYANDNYESTQGKGIANAAMMVTYGTTFLVQMYDARTTIRAIDAGAREVNPLLAPFSTESQAIVAMGLVRATVIDLALRSIAHHNRWAAVVTGAALNSGYLMVASHNNRVAQAMRAQPTRP